jgi:hypothetical protein
MTTRTEADGIFKNWEGQGGGLYDGWVDQLLLEVKVYSLLELDTQGLRV